MISLIAAIGKNNELGLNNQLIFHLKDDMKFFKETTTGHPIVMGRKTWESLPGKLPNRKNIVVSHHDIPGADRSISDLSAFLQEIADSPEEYFIIGGGTLYEASLPFAKHLYLTEIAASSSADTFFPYFDKSKYTKTILKKGRENDLTYQIARYTLI
ncbi:dihydrofolate reductase [Candidatus Saccharibacteria bacterium]|nr:dihydrofolate reductase [Candidatus Saccharibacteria bacterium]